MSLQLGLIVLPSDTAELNKVLEALSKLGVSSVAAPAVVKAAAGKGKTAPVVEEEPETETLPAVTADQVKTAMTRVRDELGDETITELLTAFGATKLKDVAKDDWSALVAAANAALNPAAGSGDDDDGFGLDDDGDDGFGLDDDDGAAEVDAEEVKVNVQTYAKKHGKEKAQAILTKHGLNTVRGLASAANDVLAKINAAALKL
jgi:hypothetical protein